MNTHLEQLRELMRTRVWMPLSSLAPTLIRVNM